MKFKDESDKIIYEAMELDEATIIKKLQLVKKSIDKKKSRDGKNNWRRNKTTLKKGIKKWHKSTNGKRFHKALGRFNALRENAGLDVITDALFGINSIETHLVLELKFYESDIEALSQFLEIFQQFNESTTLFKQNLTEAYTSGVLKSDIKEEISELFEFFLDPKMYYYTLRELNNKSNNILEIKNDEKEKFNLELQHIDENLFSVEIFNYIDEIISKG